MTATTDPGCPSELERADFEDEGEPRRERDGLQHAGKGLGRKQVAARAAGGEQDGPVLRGRDHARRGFSGTSVSAALGRLRVTAIRKPMPSANEITDEPP